jgi:hypothetical protein
MPMTVTRKSRRVGNLACIPDKEKADLRVFTEAPLINLKFYRPFGHEPGRAVARNAGANPA